MKRHTIFNLAALVFIAGTFVACEYSQDVDPIISPDDYPVLTVTPVGEYSALDEGDTIYFNVSIDKMNERSLTIGASVVGGDADDNDIQVSPAVIQPYSTSATMMVIFPQDWDAESTESMHLQPGIFSLGEKYQVNPSTVYPVLDLSLTNYVSTDITVTVGWEGIVAGMEAVEKQIKLANGDVLVYIDSMETEYDAASMVDYDILISPAEDFDPADPWASDMGNYSAATGKNPEVFTATLDDGEYILWADLWVNDFYNTFYAFSDSTVKIPVSANFRQQGLPLNVDLQPNDDQVPFAYVPGADDGGGFDGVIAKIIVADGVYSVEPYTEGLARKMAIQKAARPKGIRK
jgi:hypothetical protein